MNENEMKLERLVDCIADDLKLNTIRPNRELIKELLAMLKISGGWEFGKHYNYDNPFQEFRRGYLDYIFDNSQFGMGA